MNKQPTQKQIKELWEWCGFCYHNLTEPHDYLKTECKKCGEKFENIYNVPQPPEIIDLNNLFKYAVPKLVEKDPQIEITLYKPHPSCDFEWGCYINDDFGDFRTGKDPALALFWAIYSIIDKSPPIM